ncbi:CrcB family protein [Paenibacillus filicis]
MMVTQMMWVAAGGFPGAIARYVVGRAISSRVPSDGIPYGTLTINVLGSFLIGLLWGHGPSQGEALLFGTGFLGAFTTFSTLKLESDALFRAGKARSAWLYLGLSYTAGLLLAAAGYAL